VRFDVGALDEPVGEQHVQQCVAKRDVGAGPDREVEVGRGRRIRAPRVDDDQLRLGSPRAGVLDPTEQDRMRPSGVRAAHEIEVGVVDVLVAGGGCVGAERELVSGDRRRHAESRVGVDVVGADQGAGELVEDVVVLGKELAGDVEPDRVGTVLADDRGEPSCGEVERLAPARAAPGRGAVAPELGVVGAGVVSRREMQRRALRAQAAEVRRMSGIAAHVGHAAVVGRDDHAAAHPAVAAGGPGLAHVFDSLL
jgi:hypothetical protein